MAELLTPKKFLAASFCLGLFFLLPLTAEAQGNVQVDAVVPGTCGNNTKEIGEQCDGPDLAGASCQSLGYATGTLSCGGACSFDVSSCSNPPPSPPSSPSESGGGGSSLTFDDQEQNLTRVVLEGVGYPDTLVRLLVDGRREQMTRTNSAGNFSLTTENIPPGLHTFMLQSADSEFQGQTQSVTVETEGGTVTRVRGLVFSPAVSEVAIDTSTNQLSVSGVSVPRAMVTVNIAGDLVGVFTTESDGQGNWQSSLNIPENTLAGTITLELTASMRYEGGMYTSPTITRQLSFSQDTTSDELFEDLNFDGRVNNIDFFIMRYWWLTARQSAPDLVDLSRDGRFTLEDFSVLMSAWSG